MSISKLKALLLVTIVIVATTTIGYYYYVQSQASRSSPPGLKQSSPPSSSPTELSPSLSPSTSATSSPTSTPTSSSQPTPTATQAPTPTPNVPGYYLSTLSINPSEPWPGDPITITAQITNNQVSGSTIVSLNINGATVGTQTIQIPSGTTQAISFTASEISTGTYNIQLGTLSGSFNVVPTGEHTLSVTTSYPGIQFSLDGQPEATPFSRLVTVGTHTVAMSVAVSSYTFQSWEDGETNPTRTINVMGPTDLTAQFSGGRSGSCPSLFTWNGNTDVYSSEISDGPGWLGFINYFQSDGSIVFAYSNPWSYIKLDNTQLQPENGQYKLSITQISDEIFYLDSGKLLTVDHPSNVDVYSTRGTYLNSLSDQGTIYTISKNLSTPISALNNGQDVLSLISKQDGNFTSALRWTWNTLDLNLGNLTNAQQINLVVNAVIGWPTDQAGGDWASQFASQPGVTPSPPPYMEVKDAGGNWVKVPGDREFPIPPVNANSFVVNLTGLFPTNDFELRICYYQDISFDYIGVDTTIQQPIIVQSTAPSNANLAQEFTTNSTSTGDFTRYGNVTELLQNADDMYVIGRQGDCITLEFPANTNPIPSGMVRDYFLVASCWFKGNGLSYLPFTVNPLPFQNMTSYLYPSTENYPSDVEHTVYIQNYDTRSIQAQTNQTVESAYNLNIGIKASELLVAYATAASLIASVGVIFCCRKNR